MDIERLRALEKKWRAAGDAETKRADGDGLSDGEQGWHHGRGEQYDNCADELAALIAELGQEVGAVAEIGELNGTKLIVGRDEEALARLPKGTKLYASSPAHTSEARDACETCQFFASGPEGAFFTKTLADAENLIDVASFDRDEWTVTDLQNPTGDAAMRQEGGTP